VCRISVIILRKFGIAFTALMFNKNPEFQMAVALLVMFGAYALQVRFVPYLSPAEHANIVKDHERKAAEGVRVHVYLAAQVTEVLARGRKAATFSKTGARSRRLGASV
jgi:NADH:ubiquinone oxidoreductase subunit 6 (subunit J)